MRACGVGFLKECDPYEVLQFVEVLKEADHHCRSDAGGPAVVIAKHACMLDRQARQSQRSMRLRHRLRRLPTLPGKLRVPGLTWTSQRPGDHRRGALRGLRGLRPRLPGGGH